MVFVVVPFRQEPEFVSAVVEPLVSARGKVFACELRIHEQVRMSGESHLHQPPAILGNDDQLYPAVRELLRVPAFIVNGLEVAIWILRRIGATECGQSDGWQECK